MKEVGVSVVFRLMFKTQSEATRALEYLRTLGHVTVMACTLEEPVYQEWSFMNDCMRCTISQAQHFVEWLQGEFPEE